MWTEDEHNRMMADEERERELSDTEQVAEFFDRCGYLTVIDYNTLEDMYQMFRKRYELEQEGHTF